MSELEDGTSFWHKPNQLIFRLSEKPHQFIFRLSVITLLFVSVFYLLEFILGVKHEISVFLSFLILPLIFLMFQDLHQRSPLQTIRSLGTFHGGFLEGLLVYLIFTGYVFFYFLWDRDFFTRYDKSGVTLLVSLLFTALNVMSVDFFTKRFIQCPLSLRYGSRVAVTLQIIVWLAAHYPESLWLDELMGGVGVWIFLFITGLITGISYERTKNVGGQMAGHVMLNIFVMVFATFS